MRLQAVFVLGMIVLSSVLILPACNLSSARMTAPVFDTIAIGSSIDAVEEQAGPPYSVKEEKGGIQVYQYVERIQIGPAVNAQNTYLLTVVNGVVVGKKCLKD